MKDPICGMTVSDDAPLKADFQGETFRFCSEHCLATFQAAPAKYAGAAGDIDPVCGMTVAAGGPHRFSHGGKDYGFCCAGCLEKFKADPARYLSA